MAGVVEFFLRQSASEQIVFRGLREPGSLDALTAAEWDRLLRGARRAGVLSRLAVVSCQNLDSRDLSPQILDQLSAARLVARHHERTLRWEVNRVRRALQPTAERIVLLKGAAYLLAGLPAGAGRLASDVDILFPKDRLDIVERALVDAGWKTMKLDPYDQRYFREWMHELPPMRHETRGTVLDVHHTILPETARLRPDAGKLIESIVEIDDNLFVLAAEDMVLHSATHLFADGDLEGGLREVVDLDSLFRHFGGVKSDFWDRLVPRSEELNLQRPLFYALRVCRRLLDTPIPENVTEASRAGRPWWPATPVMESLARRALLPDTDGINWRTGAALWILYVRSHWMRMPIHLLVQHLTRKTLRKWFGEGET